MELTNEEIASVQQSWDKCIPISEKAAELFYGKLFELDPELKPLFKSDLGAQGKKLMTMITFAVRGLSDLPGIVQGVQELGVRHLRYGVREAHYDTVGEALLWTLAQGLGADFDDDLRTSWVKVYTLLAQTMKDAARGVAA